VNRFRWVALQLGELQNLGQKRRILKALENLPATLEETYDRILRNIDAPSREQAITALHWMSFSSRPLGFDEFAELMALNGQDDPVLDVEDRFSNPNEALRFLPGLVTSSINKDKDEIVTFSHFTVREYLLSGPMSIGNLTYTFEDKIAHETIAELCFRYMIQVMDVSKSWRQLKSEYPLFYYAATHSFAHASKSLNESLTSLIMDFTVPGSKCWESWTQAFGINSKGDVIIELRDAVPASPLYYVACFGLSTIVKAIVARDGNIDDDVGFYGTPLQAAARFDREEIVKFLLEQGADPNHRSGFDRSALHAAVLQWNETIVDMLLDHGADLNWDRQTGETSDADDALRVAVTQGSESMVRKILTRGEGVFPETAYKSLFLNAAHWGHVDLVNLIMTESDMNARFRDEWIPGALMKATKGSKKEIATSLLEKTEEIHAIDDDSASLIKLAFEKGNPYVLGLLLEEQVLHEEKDLCGRFILQLVTGDGYPNPLEFFLVGMTTPGGDTVQQISVAAQYRRLVKLILDRERTNTAAGEASPPPDPPSHQDLIRKILTYRPNVDVPDKSGSTALHKIARKPGSANLIAALLDAGANIEAKHGSTTPLIDATLTNDESNLAILLDRGADITATDELGNNVLHCAASSGNDACIIRALNAGANIAARTDAGATPAESAKERGHDELAEWLFSVQCGPTTEEIKFGFVPSTDEGNALNVEGDIRFLALEKARTRTF
jgi:ankyrin repeat protein